MNFSIVTFSFLLSVLFATPSVSAKLKKASMALPETLVSVERLPVEGRQGWRHLQRLAFGEFSVDSINRSITKGSDLEIMRYEGSKRRQHFSFTHNEMGAPFYRVVATTNLRRRAIDAGFDVEIQNKSGFVAELRSIEHPEEIWTIELSESGERPLTGKLAFGSQAIAITGTNKLAGTRFPNDETTGYLFELRGDPIAAVEVINSGSVWISGQANDFRSPISAAASALLLLEELRKTLPE